MCTHGHYDHVGSAGLR
ncbi:MAG: hypothetical protein ACLVJH_15225 [Faecalibacterium prausnitzii]